MKLKRYLKNKNLLIGSIIIGILLLMMVISIFYTPYSPNKMDTSQCLKAPSLKHLLGTDNFGRDILSRLMKGSEIVFLVGFSSVVIGLFFGIIIGSPAGYFGGIIDELLMRIIDTKMAFPGVLLALMLISIFGTAFSNLLLALGIMSISRFARIIRSGYIQLKESEFVKAERARGAGDFRIMYIHILPNIMSQIVVTCSLGFASAVLAEAGLSYLGLGVQPPNSSWGRMLNEAQGYITSAPWYAVETGVLITMVVMGFNLIGDGIRDINDKRL